MAEFRLEQRPEITIKQQLTPKLIQTVKIMQLAKLELSEQIQQEIQENPMLEQKEDETKSDELDEELNELDRDLKDWERFYDGMRMMNTHLNYGTDNEDETPIEPIIASRKTFWEHLHDQLSTLNLSRRGEVISEYIIGDLDNRGFLTISTEEIAAKVNEEEKFIPKVNDEEVEEYLKHVQDFDPPGIAARDIRESFIIQLKAMKYEDTLAYQLVDKYFDDLMHKNSVKLANMLDVSIKEIEEAKGILSSLSFSPATEDEVLSSEIDPDLIVRKTGDGEWEIIYNYSDLPMLTINREYYTLLKKQDDLNDDTKEFLRKKLTSARWWISSLNQRRETILSIMQEILNRQIDFFETSEQKYLKALKMEEVAERVGVDVSTISRAVSGKYVQAPFGVYSLRSFFVRGLQQKAGEETVSTARIKEMIREMVNTEDQSKPLSDQKIVDNVRLAGIDISRRAVTKYRHQLGIPSSRLRKRKR